MTYLNQLSNGQHTTEMLRAAMQYAESGWSVFPVHHPQDKGCSCGHPRCRNVGKHPRTVHGVKNATTDPAIIKGWWRKWPTSNIGIHVGRSGLVVIDIDPRHSGREDRLPLAVLDLITPTAQTGGGGIHLFYRAPIGFEISNSGRVLPQGIDVRAGNSYIVAPPSRHQSGYRYSWRPGLAPWEILMLPLPASLMPLLKVKTAVSAPPISKPAHVPKTDNRGSRSAYVEKALQAELGNLAQATKGNRNNCLNKVAFNLGQFVEAGLLPRDEVESLLQATAQAIGLGEVEIEKTINSGISAGITNPRRSWPELIPIGQQPAITKKSR